MRLLERIGRVLVLVRARAAPVLGPVRAIHACAMTVTGWISGDDARAMVRECMALPDNPVIVEVGIFMGRSTALLAGARRMRGSGQVFCIDPFDCSGDGFSVPVYKGELQASKRKSLEDAFIYNMTRLGLMPWIKVCRAPSSTVARAWTQPIDLLLLDADYTEQGAKAIFDEWIPFLKPGGLLMLPNSSDREHPAGHDGNRRLVENELLPPRFVRVRTINDLTIATAAT